jgi:hypothetical protein
MTERPPARVSASNCRTTSPLPIAPAVVR